MSSPEDMFLDTSFSPEKMGVSVSDEVSLSTPSSPLVPSPGLTPYSSSTTPPAPTQTTWSPPSPTPPSPTESFLHPSHQATVAPVDVNLQVKSGSVVQKIKIEFFDSTGRKIRQTRYSENIEIIDIISTLVRGSEAGKNQSTITKFCDSS